MDFEALNLGKGSSGFSSLTERNGVGLPNSPEGLSPATVGRGFVCEGEEDVPLAVGQLGRHGLLQDHVVDLGADLVRGSTHVFKTTFIFFKKEGMNADRRKRKWK